MIIAFRAYLMIAFHLAAEKHFPASIALDPLVIGFFHCFLSREIFQSGKVSLEMQILMGPKKVYLTKIFKYISQVGSIINRYFPPFL